MIPEDKLTIETPEQIPLEFPLAGIGSRFLAQVIDTFVLLGIYLSVGLIGAALLYAGRRLLADAGMWVLAGMILVFFAVTQGYYIGFETLWNGQTPGKRRIHLRVITDSGRPISVYEALARNMLRVVDSLPGFYAIGILTVLFSRRNKRLGDLVAGTVVVHERPLRDVLPVWAEGAPPLPARYAGFSLTPQEVELIETFLARRAQFEEPVRRRAAVQICDRLARTRAIAPEDRQAPEALLEALARAHRSAGKPV